MKKISFYPVYALFMSLVLSCMQLVALAQEAETSTKTTTRTTTTTTWYTEPWVWIVGGAVFILILIALLRGGSSSDRDVSKTTVIRD